MTQNSGANATSTLAGQAATSSPTGPATSTPQSSQAPIIQVNGANPAVIHVGDTYSDLGATITGPSQDLNLGIQTFLNGMPMNPIIIDTSKVATDTIAYVATDQNGMTSTSTRTVIIAPIAPPPTITASTTTATTTATTGTTQ